MPRRDLHKKPYDEGTQDKLDLFHDYLQVWCRVFTNVTFVNTLQIFDFFAGPGCDTNGKLGSPGIICEEIRKVFDDGEIKQDVCLFFNELNSEKFKELKIFLDKQKRLLPRVKFFEKQCNFHNAFKHWAPNMQSGAANLLFLDQNGLDQINRSIFQSIVTMPKTDFIFFIASSMVNRFKNNPEIRKYVPITNDDVKVINGTNVHRLLANAYQRWIPKEMEYYLGSFSIKKGANVYGLIFGSGHLRGIDKFLRVAWKHGGDANFDIDNDHIDPMNPSLFEELDKRTKIKDFEIELEKEIFNRHLRTNKDIFIFASQNGMLASHARDALNVLVKNKKLPTQKFHISYEACKKPTEIIQHFKEAD